MTTQDLLRLYQSMGEAILKGIVVDARKLEDYRRELIRRGVNVELERQKIIKRGN